MAEQEQNEGNRAGITMEDLMALNIIAPSNDEVDAAQQAEAEDASFGGEATKTPSEVLQTPVTTPEPTPVAVQPHQQQTPEAVLRERASHRAGMAKEILMNLLKNRLKNSTNSKDLIPLIRTSFELTDAFQQQIDVDYIQMLRENGFQVAIPEHLRGE
jgi:hypothetical protein